MNRLSSTHSIKSLRTLLAMTLLSVLLLPFTSCTETTGEDDEYADWQQRNDDYFQKLYDATSKKIAAGDKSWKIIKCFSLPDYNVNYTASSTDNIIVHVVDSSKSASGSPLYTDSVKVNYLGRLMPTAQHPQGYVFDKSFTGDYSIDTAQPSVFKVSGVVDGFATALQHMKIGDRWEVYIPWKLGYGETKSGSIPAYSTLVFDMQLRGYYRANYQKGESDAKTGSWATE